MKSISERALEEGTRYANAHRGESISNMANFSEGYEKGAQDQTSVVFELVGNWIDDHFLSLNEAHRTEIKKSLERFITKETLMAD